MRRYSVLAAELLYEKGRIVYDVGVGIIGAGFIGQVHAHAARLAGARLAGIVAADPARSRQAAAEAGAERPFGTAAELIDDPQVTVVHVCTPNYLHQPLVRHALARGKHVVCEKPLAMTAAEAAELASLASSAGVVAAVPFVYRYHAVVQEARERVTSGLIGPVHLVHGSYLQDWLSTPDDGNWRVVAALGGASRAFADIGSHWCDLIEWVTGRRITELAATVETVVKRRPRTSGHSFEHATGPAQTGMREVDTEDLACMVFRAADGITGTLTVSQVSPGRKNRIWFEIDGSEASLVFNEEHPETLFIGRRGLSEILTRDPAVLSAGSRPGTLPPGHHQGFLDGFAAFLHDVYGAVCGTVPHRHPTFEDGLRSAQITEAVLRSSEQRTWVQVPG